jgi:hypothetical protein
VRRVKRIKFVGWIRILEVIFAKNHFALEVIWKVIRYVPEQCKQANFVNRFWRVCFNIHIYLLIYGIHPWKTPNFLLPWFHWPIKFYFYYWAILIGQWNRKLSVSLTNQISRPCQCFDLSRPCQCFDLSRPSQCFDLSKPSLVSDI